MATHIEDLTYKELRSMSTSELKSLVSQNAKRLNQRAQRVEKAGAGMFFQGAVQQMKESGGRFKTPNTKKALLKEATRERQFARNPASTVRGARKVFTATTEDLMKDFIKDRQDKAEAKREFKTRTNKAWEAFHKKKEEYPAIEYSKADIKNRVNEYVQTGRGISKINKFYDPYFEELENEAEPQPEEWVQVSNTPFNLV